jgi:hypothetical protein
VPRDELEAAYFTLLRAREELDGLRRYEDHLRDERARLRRFTTEGEALADRAPPRYRRSLAHTDEPLRKAVEARLRVMEDELGRLPDRLEAAETFVEECEREHAELGRST